MLRNAIVLFAISLHVFACAQNIVRQHPSVWRSLEHNIGIYMQPNTDSTGLWVDCCFDADNQAFSGPYYPELHENTYFYKGDTLCLYSTCSKVADVEGDSPILCASYAFQRKDAGIVLTNQILSANSHSMPQLFTRVDSTCHFLSHYEYLYGWDVFTDTQRTSILRVQMAVFVSDGLIDSIGNFCRMLDADKLCQCPIELELHGTNVLLNAYAEQTDISVDYTAVCSIMEHMLFFRYEDFKLFVQPSFDSISVPSCERTIVYTNGFKKVERDCFRTFSPPLRSKWFVLP